MRIIFLDADTISQRQALDDTLNARGTYITYPTTDASQTLERIAEATIVITNKVVITREMMRQTPSLRLICIAATGTNNVDLAAAHELGIEVRNVTSYSTESVVQTTFALLLALLSQTAQFNTFIHSGGYSASPLFTCLTPSYAELSGKTFGIIGLGTIGRRVAQVAEAFGAHVVYCSTSGVERKEAYDRVALDELLQTADVVSIHAPLTEQTASLIHYDRLMMMKHSAYLINTGRGGIIVEQDLARALDEGVIAGAGLDVFSREPLPTDNPLLHSRHPERLIMTPHIAWASIEAQRRLCQGILSNIDAVMADKKDEA